MLKSLLPLFFLVFSFTAFAQENQPIAHFSDNGIVLQNHGTESWSVFTMETTESDMDWMAAELKKYEREFTLEVGEKDANGHYKCKLVFSHHIDIRYLHKILKTVHVQNFTIGNDSYQLDQLITLNR